jgi:hypothetical protein
MRTAIVVGCVVAALVAGTPLSRLATSAAEDKKQEDKKQDTITIPRKEIHVSVGDSPKAEGWTEADKKIYDEILTCVKKTGPSNIILVSGDDFRWAVASTYQAYNFYTTYNATGVFPARDPKGLDLVLPKKGQRFGVWVVAYLGMATSDQWTIKSVERTGTRIRVVYTANSRQLGDDVAYMLWAPLGPLEEGKYTLELYETNDKEVSLSRLVKVK